MNRKSRHFIMLFLLLFIFILPVFTNQFSNFLKSTNQRTELKTSEDSLYANYPQNFYLDDFYNDSDLTHIYTDANFQKVYVPTDEQINESVAYVNNYEGNTPSNTGITMINGTTNNLDNMHSDDNSYTTFSAKGTSTEGMVEDYDEPAQWGEFSFTKGSGTSTGNLRFDDVDIAVLTSGATTYSETYVAYIKPISDVTTNWNEGDVAPHWSKLDEATGDMNGDGGNIRETTQTVHDRWNMGTYSVPAGYKVTKMVVWGYCMSQAGKDMGVGVTSNMFSGTLYWDPHESSGTYVWKSDTKSGLALTSLTGMYLDVVPVQVDINAGYVDIETVYIDIYTTQNTIYTFDYTITWAFPSGTALMFYYDYSISVAVDMDMDIWDWVSSSWLELRSYTGTGFVTGSYDLEANPNKVSGSNQVRIRFQSASSSTSFYHYIDQLTVKYEYLGLIAGDYYLDFTIVSPAFTTYTRDDLLALKISSNHFTNISTATSTYIYDFHTSSWVQLWSATRTSETQETYTITSNIDYYFNGSGCMKLFYTLVDSDGILLSLDYIQFLLVYKLDLVHTTSFDRLGEWKYRWEIIGSVYYTQWVSFTVIGMANFEAISESDYSTRWILQNSTISPVEDFHDDINTNYWNLVDVDSSILSKNVVFLHDSEVRSIGGDNNYGSLDYMRVYYYNPNEYWTFVGQPTTYYIHQNTTGLSYSYIKMYVYSGAGGYIKIDLCETTSFDESTITWNNKPATGSEIINEQQTSLSWNTFILDDYAYTGYWLLKPAITYPDVCSSNFYSSEYYTTKPYLHFETNKNYFGSGYMYMQTNTTETIGLLSQDYGTHYTLSSGEYFSVDFQTSSDSQVNLILYKNGVLNKTLTLSPSGNTNFNRHTVQIPVSEIVEFDQLKINSTFEDTDYIKVYDIKTYTYGLGGDYADFYLGSKRSKEIYLTPSDTEYNMRIYEIIGGSEQLRINENLTISASGQTQYMFVPTITQISRVRLLTMDNIPLIFSDYNSYVNRSLNGEYNYIPLYSDTFQVDMSTYAYFYVYDRFESLVLSNQQKLVSDFINLNLEVYQLQIKNLQEQKTTIDINSSFVFPLLSGESLSFTLSKAYYQIGYYNPNNVYKQFTIYLNSNQAYELNRSKMCFLVYTNQRGEYLPFNNYKTYINASLLYYNVFYKEVGDSINITIRDHYDYDVSETIYTVISGDNYIPIILTQYSLKIKNSQEIFNHVNITRDPIYYSSPYSWSEWIAPAEIISFRLFAGYYKINITDYEHSSYSYYAYTLNGDDIILITSDNTLSSIITNIVNVNTTIGNQITNVQIDLTNQNSAINNSIINIDINLSNVNSTLGNLLTTISLDITNVNNNISSLFVFTNNSFINLQNNINNSFIYLENNILSINQSISNLVIGVSNNLMLINGTISTLIIDIGNDLLLMNTSIHTLLFNLDTDITEIGNNITNNYILLNNSINLTNNNINDSRIVILNNLALINNTLSTLISNVYTSVYLINNSIYTAIMDLGTSLSLINNTIAGNLSIVLKQNDFLTELYKTAMFSELLNWTIIGTNSSLIESQIDAWEFINNYKDESITVFLRYQDEIENLTVSAQNTLEQLLPKENVEYRLWSVANEEYISEWELLPENRTISFGFYEEEIPYNPEPIIITFWNILIFIGFLAFLIVGALKMYYTSRNKKTPIPPELLRYMNKKNKKHINGAVDNRI